jgi:hypothetical protein
MFDTPEAKFLIAIVSQDDPCQLKEELRRLCEKIIDWQKVSYTPLNPAMYFATKDFYNDIGIPADIFQKWGKEYWYYTAMNMQSFEEIKTIANGFEKNNIDLIFLKGATEIVTVYSDNPGLRIMRDLDLLIRPSDLDRAGEIMEKELGYVSEHSYVLKGNIPRSYVKTGCKLVDIHSTLSLDFEYLPEKDFINECFEKKESIAADGAEVCVPDPTSRLALCILHGIKYDHFPCRVCWYWQEEIVSTAAFETVQYKYVADLAYKIKNMVRYSGNRIDWERIKGHLQGCENKHRIRLVLAVCRACCIDEIPADVYSLFRIPRKVNNGFLKRTRRQAEACFLGNAFSRLLKKSLTLKALAKYMLAFFVDLETLWYARNIYRKAAQHAKPENLH